MKEMVFLLEEPSAEALLRGLLPRLFPSDLQTRFIVFEGKQDLERQMVRKLRGYRNPEARFVILRDQDAADCSDVKGHLVELCRKAGKDDTMVRIACHELESWFLADLAAVETGLELPGLSAYQRKSKYRNPDSTLNPARELFRLTCNQYQKIRGSRAIGPHLDIDNQRSGSFKAFIEGLRKLIHES